MKLLNWFLLSFLLCIKEAAASPEIFSGGNVEEDPFPSRLFNNWHQDDSRESQRNVDPFSLITSMLRSPMQSTNKKPGENISKKDSIFEVETHPSPDSLSPRFRYKVNSNNMEAKHSISPTNEDETPLMRLMNDLFHDSREDYKPKRKKHHKKHHRHHKKRPKMEFHSETEITLHHAKNNSDSPQDAIKSNSDDTTKKQKPKLIKEMIHSLVNNNNSPQNPSVLRRNNPKVTYSIFKVPKSRPVQILNSFPSQNLEYRRKYLKLGQNVDDTFPNTNYDPETQYLSKLAPITSSTTSRPMLMSIQSMGHVRFSKLRPKADENPNKMTKTVENIANKPPFMLQTTRLHVIDGGINQIHENPVSPLSPNNFNKNKQLFPGIIKNIHLPDKTVKVQYSPVIVNNPGLHNEDIQALLGEQHNKDLFHPKLSHGELLVPQTKVITMSVKTKTVKLPPTAGDNRGPIPDFDGIRQSPKPPKRLDVPQIHFASPKKTVANKIETKPQRPITIISHTQVFFSLGNQTNLKKENATSVKNPTRINNNGTKMGNVKSAHEKAMEALKPHCPNGADILRGGLEFLDHFSDAHGWRASLAAFKATLSEAQEALGRCFEKMWHDTKAVFTGRKKRQSQVNIEKLAQDFKDDFNKNVASPVAKFFGSLSTQIASSLEKRSIENQNDILSSYMVEENFKPHVLGRFIQDESEKQLLSRH